VTGEEPKKRQGRKRKTAKIGDAERPCGRHRLSRRGPNAPWVSGGAIYLGFAILDWDGEQRWRAKTRSAPRTTFVVWILETVGEYDRISF
jgi:hypothetical protein